MADVPLIRAAQARGFSVVTSGNRPEEAGHLVSDRYCPGDYSDPQAMLAIAMDLDIDAICACCNDFSALSSAFVAEQLGLPGHDPLATCELIHHKDRFRAYAQRQGLPSPRAKQFDEPKAAVAYVETVRFNVIIKPVDLTGGKGMQRSESVETSIPAVHAAFAASKAKRIVIEEYIEGSNHGLSCILKNGRIVFWFDDNETYYLNPYLVSGAYAPGTAPPRAIETLIETAESMAEDLELVDGIFHIQFILDAETEQPYIIEICRRPPGDLYIELVRLATGLNYPDCLVRAAAGLSLADIAPARPSGFFGRHCIMTNEAGTVRDVEIDPTVAPCIRDSVTWWEPGMSIKDPLVDKLGIVFLEFGHREEMREKMQNMQKLIKVRMAS